MEVAEGMETMQKALYDLRVDSAGQACGRYPPGPLV
jgi:hypothetical protein